MKKFQFLFFILLLFMVPIYAKSSQEKIDLVSSIVYKDCNGEVLEFSTRFIPGESQSTLPYFPVKEYSFENLKNFLQIIDNYSWMEIAQGGGGNGVGYYGHQFLKSKPSAIEFWKVHS